MTRLLLKILAYVWLISLPSQVAGQLLPVRENGRWGLINYQGEIVIPVKYDAAQSFEGTQWVEVMLNGQIGMVHTNGTEIFIPGVQDIHVFHDSSFAYLLEDQWGVMNQERKDILRPEWDAISMSPSGQYFVTKNDRKALVDRSGNKLTPLQYNYLHPFKTGYYKGLIGDTLHLIDDQGRVRFEGKEQGATYPLWPTLIVKKNDRIGLHNVESTFSCEAKWYKYQQLSASLFCLSTFTESMLFNVKTGKSTPIPAGAEFNRLNTSLFRVQIPNLGKWGLITDEPNYVLPMLFTDIYATRNFLLVRDTFNRMGVYNMKGQMVLPHKYSNILRAPSGAFLLYKRSKRGLASPSGRIIIEADNYTSLKVYNGLIKATGPSGAVIFELDSNWNITNRYEYRNVRTVYLSSAKRAVPSSDPTTSIAIPARQLSPDGWFNASDASSSKAQWGYKDSTGRTKILPRFERIEFLNNERALLYRENDDLDEPISVLDGSYNLRARWALATSNEGNIIANDQFWIIDRNAAESTAKVFITGILPSGDFQIIQPGRPQSKATYTFVDSLWNGYARVAKGGYLSVTNQTNYEFNVKSQTNFRRQFGLSMFDAKNENHVRVEQAQWGYVDSSGHFVIDHKFDFAQQFENGRAIVMYDKKWGVINTYGEFVIPPQYEKIERIRLKNVHFFKTFSKAPRYGYIDTLGLIVIPPQYLETLPHGSNHIGTRTKSGWAFVDYKGRLESDTFYDEIISYTPHFAGAKLNRSWKVIDDRSDLLPGEFQQLGDLGQQCLWVKDQGYYKLISTSGRTLSKKKYTTASLTVNDLSIVRLRGKTGILSPDGHFLVKPKYENITPFNQDGYAVFKSNLFLGVMDTLGAEIIPATYKSMTPWTKGFAISGTYGQNYVIDLKGNARPLPEGAYDCQAFSEGLAQVKVSGKWGYVDTSGQWIIDAVFDESTPFMDGIALVSYKQKQYLITRSGELNQRFYGQLISPFQKGIAIAKRNKQLVFVDKTGKTLFGKSFQAARPFNEHHLAQVKYMGKWGLINTKGQFVMYPRFAYIEPFKDGICAVKVTGTYGLYHENGQMLIKNENDDLEQFRHQVVKTQTGNSISYFDLNSHDWIWHQNAM